jgi:hypothetical protein
VLWWAPACSLPYPRSLRTRGAIASAMASPVGGMYRCQAALPSLPVAAIEPALARYLDVSIARRCHARAAPRVTLCVCFAVNRATGGAARGRGLCRAGDRVRGRRDSGGAAWGAELSRGGVAELAGGLVAGGGGVQQRAGGRRSGCVFVLGVTSGVWASRMDLKCTHAVWGVTCGRSSVCGCTQYAYLRSRDPIAILSKYVTPKCNAPLVACD